MPWRRQEVSQVNLLSPRSSPDPRSRLADFHANCRASYQTLTSCPTDNYQACLGSYAGMIGKPPQPGISAAPSCPWPS